MQALSWLPVSCWILPQDGAKRINQKQELAVSSNLRYNNGIENALRFSSIQGNGQADADSLTQHNIAAKAVRVNLRLRVSGRLLFAARVTRGRRG